MTLISYRANRYDTRNREEKKKFRYDIGKNRYDIDEDRHDEQKTDMTRKNEKK